MTGMTTRSPFPDGYVVVKSRGFLGRGSTQLISTLIDQDPSCSYQQGSGYSHDGPFAAAARFYALILFRQVRIASYGLPGTLDQKRSNLWFARSGDVAQPHVLAGGVLTGRKAYIGGQLSGPGKPGDIAQFQEHLDGR